MSIVKVNCRYDLLHERNTQKTIKVKKSGTKSQQTYIRYYERHCAGNAFSLIDEGSCLKTGDPSLSSPWENKKRWLFISYFEKETKHHVVFDFRFTVI
jgi:hypothetical protein